MGQSADFGCPPPSKPYYLVGFDDETAEFRLQDLDNLIIYSFSAIHRMTKRPSAVISHSL
jgi:hypothetical protein